MEMVRRGFLVEITICQTTRVFPVPGPGLTTVFIPGRLQRFYRRGKFYDSSPPSNILYSVTILFSETKVGMSTLGRSRRETIVTLLHVAILPIFELEMYI